MKRQVLLAFTLVAVVIGGNGPPAAADGADDDSGLKSESLTLLELSGLPQGEKAAVRKVVAKGMSEIRLCFRAYYGERLVERRLWVVLNVDAHGRIASVSYANPTSTARVANPKELAQCVRASLEKDAGARLPSKRRIVLPFRYFPRVQPQELFGTTRGCDRAEIGRGRDRRNPKTRAAVARLFAHTRTPRFRTR